MVLRGALGAGKSSIAAQVIFANPSVRVVEVDDVKRRSHGTTEKSTRADYVQAGVAARKFLDAGHDTLLVEAFVDQRHLSWALEAIGRTEDDPAVHMVWLDCDRPTALRRKHAMVSDRTILEQHARYPQRYRAAREHFISTDRREVADVALEIVAILNG